MNNFICKIASLDEMNEKWDYEISHCKTNKKNWIVWKKQAIEDAKKGYIIPYYGILDGKIICEATAKINSKNMQNYKGLIEREIAYLEAFRTIDEYKGKGYFSKLFRFIINDLKKKGFKKVTLGVEPKEKKNIQIYEHLGFKEFIKTGKEIYPDGTEITVNYYGKTL